MPYEIDNQHPGCIGFAVVNTQDGELEGCHRTETQAKAQLATLNMAEMQDGVEDEDAVDTMQELGARVEETIPNTRRQEVEKILADLRAVR